MLDAVLRDLAEIPGLQLRATRDRRSPPLCDAVEQVRIGEADDVWRVWEECIRWADAVWPVAPESGGVLERLSALTLLHGKRLLNSGPQAVALTASKLATAQHMHAAGVPWVATFAAGSVPRVDAQAWVLKPDDGVGCEQTQLFADREALSRWLAGRDRPDARVAQPYLAGIPASLCVLCNAGRAWLLSCNRQRVSVERDSFVYRGSILNDLASHWPAGERLAAAVARAIPGLAGYVGIDAMLHEGELTGLEINPRLTTSYAGLRRALGCNPARLVLDLVYNEYFELPQDMRRELVPIALDD